MLKFANHENSLHSFIRFVPLAVSLAMALSSAHAATHTWNGGGANGNWNTGANWVGGSAPANTNEDLIFAGSIGLDATNTTMTSVRTLTFAANASDFELWGNSFDLNLNITNYSSGVQKIHNNIRLNANSTFTVVAGELAILGDISETTSKTLIKAGAGTLTLGGSNTFTGQFSINGGRLVLEAGASFTAGKILFNQTSGAVIEGRGAASGTTTINVGREIDLGNNAGENRIVVDSNGGDGTTLVFTNIQTGGFYSQTLNIDLSAANSALKLNNVMTGVGNSFLTTSFSGRVTVTDGTKTGFAARDTGTGLVTRNVPTNSLPTSGGNANTNYYISGSQALTAAVSAQSLTIQGAGTLSGGTNSINSAYFLMEEGVGDYTVGVDSFGNNGIYIHQYSTDGTLTFTGNRGSSGGTYRYYGVIKTGPGAAVWTGSATNFAGKTDIQGGSFKLDGKLKEIQSLYVRDGATLSGSGEVGGGIQWSGGNVNIGTMYTPVTVQAGGTLDASHSTTNALKIEGTLTLDAGSTYQMHLAGGSFDALSVVNTNGYSGTIVTLNGDLKLTLGYSPTLGEDIDLLTYTNGTLSGTFATVNSGAFSPTNTFVLSGNTFQINYDSNRVWLDTVAIPEPGTVALLALGGTLGIFLFRRRRA